MMKYYRRICPRIIVKLEKNKAKAAECIVIKSDQFHYQFENIYLRLFSVDLKVKIYSCRRWKLTGIPYSHAIVAMWVKKNEPEMYVHECYTVKQYLKSYDLSILPIVNIDQWPKTGIKLPLPPIYKAQSGRPKKSRKREIDETTKKGTNSEKLTLLKISRKGRKKKYGSCGILGHNSRKCPILMSRNQTEAQHQQMYQQVKKEGPSTPTNASEVNQLNQARVRQEQLRHSEFILNEISEYSREGTRPIIIEKIGKQYVLLSKLLEALSQNSKGVRSGPRAKKKVVL
ncbi:putative rhamnogalacturonate lyase B-like [Capsicum annuum]|nr:putative rhamnogalacturonate lyase B-like [Capsicum annuum]